MPPRCGFLAVFMALLLNVVVGRHNETLFLRPLPQRNGDRLKVLAHFAMLTEEASVDATTPESAIPLVLRQVLTKFNVASLHLSFSLGKYNHERYGPPRIKGEQVDRFEAPYGVRLQVRFNPTSASEDELMARWKAVTSEVGGVFSASLNQMDETTIVRLMPGTSASDWATYDKDEGSPDSVLWQAALAREELCTENLTPWIKMLPCRAHAGLGSLVDPIHLLSGEYLFIEMFAARSKSNWTFHQRLTSVQTMKGPAKKWSLRSLFGDELADMLKTCPLAESTSILTERTSMNDRVMVASQVDKERNVLVASIDQDLDTSAVWMEAFSGDRLTTDVPAFSIHRYLTGHGQVNGGIAVRLENRHRSCAARATYVESTPWYTRMLFHTFKTQQVSLDTFSAPVSSKEMNLLFTPAELRGIPNQVRIELLIPPRSAVDISMKFEKAFVRLSEHPPDANRGFDLPSGIATFYSVNSTDAVSCTIQEHDHFARTLFTEPLLVALPTPDFSMPYNVITLTSTVVAFFVGSMLNTLLRKAPRIQRMMAEADASTKKN